MKQVSPTFRGSAFNCPFCGAYSAFEWQETYYVFSMDNIDSTGVWTAACHACNRKTLWQSRHPDEQETNDRSKQGEAPPIPCFRSEICELVYPRRVDMPLASDDMPQEVATIYEEARQVEPYSKRAAAALLRLCAEKLVSAITDSENLNDGIAKLVAVGLPQKIQQGLDIVRITGNDAIHDVAEIQLNEKPEHVTFLFQLINVIVDNHISIPNRIESAYDALPEKKRNGVARRDRTYDS